MKAPSSFSGVFIHKGAVDMRRGINGLCDVVQSSGMGDLMGKNLFVFCGKRRSSIKVLYFDRSGFCLWQKRLETDKFPWPKKHEGEIVTLSPQQFTWLLEGFDVWKIKPFADSNFERVS
jgi:transposase